jgi:hypothetical protein
MLGWEAKNAGDLGGRLGLRLKHAGIEHPEVSGALFHAAQHTGFQPGEAPDNAAASPNGGCDAAACNDRKHGKRIDEPAPFHGMAMMASLVGRSKRRFLGFMRFLGSDSGDAGHYL